VPSSATVTLDCAPKLVSLPTPAQPSDSVFQGLAAVPDRDGGLCYGALLGARVEKARPRGAADAAVEALADPAVRTRLVELGTEIFPREQQTPEALGTLQKADAAKWWPIIKQLGIKAE
jgi:hypothetical protein